MSKKSVNAINPFYGTGLFLYSLKTENQRFSNVFGGVDRDQ